MSLSVQPGGKKRERSPFDEYFTSRAQKRQAIGSPGYIPSDADVFRSLSVRPSEVMTGQVDDPADEFRSSPALSLPQPRGKKRERSPFDEYFTSRAQKRQAIGSPSYIPSNADVFGSPPAQPPPPLQGQGIQFRVPENYKGPDIKAVKWVKQKGRGKGGKSARKDRLKEFIQQTTGVKFVSSDTNYTLFAPMYETGGQIGVPIHCPSMWRWLNAKMSSKKLSDAKLDEVKRIAAELAEVFNYIAQNYSPQYYHYYVLLSISRATGELTNVTMYPASMEDSPLVTIHESAAKLIGANAIFTDIALYRNAMAALVDMIRDLYLKLAPDDAKKTKKKKPKAFPRSV